MDKNEYNTRLEEIGSSVDQGNYAEAARVADTIDWRRVRNVRTLCLVSEIYEAEERYEDAKDMLLKAYKKSPSGRSILYRLVEICIRLKQFDEAVEYYSQYVHAAPNDPNRLILKYRIYRGRGSSLDEQIDILNEYLKEEYNEKYAYELAKLYQEAERISECLTTCDDLVLWFHSGKYVIRALELKKRYAPLTPKQQEIYDHRFDMEEEEAIGAEKQMVETEDTSLAESIMEDTAREIASEVARAAGPAGPEAGGAFNDTGVSAEEISSDAEQELPQGGGEYTGVSAVMPEEEFASTRVMENVDSDLLDGVFREPAGSAQERSETAKLPPQDVPAGTAGTEDSPAAGAAEQETAQGRTDETREAAEELSKTGEGTGADGYPRAADREASPEADTAQEAEGAAAAEIPLAAQTPVTIREDKYNTKDFQDEMLRSMRAVVSGIGLRDQVDEDEAAMDALIDQSKQEQAERIESDAAQIRMTRKLTLPELQKKADAGQLSIDDVLLSMGDRGVEVRETVEEARSASGVRPQRTGVLSAVDEALLNMGVRKDDASAGQLPEAEQDETAGQGAAPESQFPDEAWIPEGLNRTEGKEAPQDKLPEAEQDETADQGAAPELQIPDEVWAPVGLKPTEGEEAPQDKRPEGSGIQKKPGKGTGKETEKEASAADRWFAVDVVSVSDGAASSRKAPEMSEIPAGPEASAADRWFAVGVLTPGEAPEAQRSPEPGEMAVPDMKSAPDMEITPDAEAPAVGEAALQTEDDVRIASVPHASSDVDRQIHEAYAQAREGLAAEQAAPGDDAAAAAGNVPGNMTMKEVMTADTRVVPTEEIAKRHSRTPLKTDEPASGKGPAEGDTGSEAAETTAGEQAAPAGDQAQAAPQNASGGQGQARDAAPERMYLKKELRGFFDGYLTIRDMDRQIAGAIEQIMAKGDDKTSRTGNVLIFGGHGCGKTTIGTGIAKAIAQERGSGYVKMAKIYAADLNRKDIAATIARIAGGVLIVEEAGDLDDMVADQLTTALEFRTDGLVLILEDEQRYIHDLLMRHPRLTMKFTSQIYIPTFTAKDLTGFAILYADDRDYAISDEAAALLQERLLGMIENSDNGVSITNVLDITDEAIARANKFSRKVFSGKKRFDSEGRVILQEKDFR